MTYCPVRYGVPVGVPNVSGRGDFSTRAQVPLVEMSSRQNHYSNGLAAEIPFDPETQEAVIRSSICTGEKVAGFKGKTDGHFTEVMVIHTPQEEERFKEIYGLEKVKKEY